MPAGGRRVRLKLPSALSTPLGYDAVGVSAHLGLRVQRLLPRTGCVFTDPDRWWWIVPARADIGISWAPLARYSPDALVTGPAAPEARPRLAHWPEDGVPYTHPILLYIALCQAAGVRPDWTGVTPAGLPRPLPR
ncbi:hypothetical protein CRI70_03655 [Streptomyces sp. Ru87]|uniref:Transposase n=1 Tax=Streptomyces lycii TaxID=2654337 RepID=A0ABQ7FPI4_9ACTN|nr:hypothetical protein GCU69_08615 [Streptomyces lycii]PGH52015.1 hypothetical protein CRI70_03655 [Streptomyces sp. Ru87]